MNLFIAPHFEFRELDMRTQIQLLFKILDKEGIKVTDIKTVGSFQFWNPQRTVEFWLASMYGKDLDIASPDCDYEILLDYDTFLEITPEETNMYQSLFEDFQKSPKRAIRYDYQEDLRAILNPCPTK
jgi:hypothetical protein